jgi:hypothetical protein
MIRATHAPATAGGMPKGPPPVRYATAPMWPFPQGSLFDEEVTP